MLGHESDRHGITSGIILQEPISPYEPLESILNGGLDQTTIEPDLFRRVIIINVALLAGITSAAVLSIVYFWISPFLAGCHLVTSVVLLALLGVVRKTHRPTLCGRIALAYLFVFFAIASWRSGGLSNPNFSWMVILPISAAIVIDTRDAKFWLTLNVLLAVAFYIAEMMGFTAHIPNTTGAPSLAYLFSHIAFFLVIGVLISAWLGRQRVLVAQLKQSLDATANGARIARALVDAATAANEGATFNSATQDCISILCDVLGWEAAQVWRRSDNESVIPVGITTIAPQSKLTVLLQNAEFLEHKNTSYLPRVAADSGVEIVQSGLQGDKRCKLGDQVGLQSVLIWPLSVDGAVDTVLEFFARQPIVFDPRARRLLEHVGLQLGHVRRRELVRGQIEKLAYYDVVTGLPNRHAFERRFGSILEAAAKRERKVALMFIDLDGFKHVNDSLGHAAGDELLRHIGEKLTDNLRSSDFAMKLSSPSTAMVARLGGDEFTIVLQSITELRGAEIVARRFLDIISQSTNIQGNEVYVNASIGIAVYPDDATQPSDLLRLADAAMYEAKNTAGNQYRFATEALNESVQRRSWMENELRRAISITGLQIHYQPIVGAGDNAINAYEALTRWQLDGHWIAPVEFIRLAEDTALIHELGEFVLRQACRNIAAHNRSLGTALRINVNVSAHEIRQEHFIARLKTVLAGSDCAAEWLVLEITEKALLIDDSVSLDVLNDLHEIGAHIALDDFGTGYASLSYLQKFPLDYVKIDRSVVEGLGHLEPNVAIAESTINLSHALGLKVIAEGVETEADMATLEAMGCDEFQGFLFGHPQPRIPV